MGKTKETPNMDVRQILIDANGKPTHVVLTIEAFQDMEELIEDLQTFREFRENRDTEVFLPLAQAKKSLGL